MCMTRVIALEHMENFFDDLVYTCCSMGFKPSSNIKAYFQKDYNGGGIFSYIRSISCALLRRTTKS